MNKFVQRVQELGNKAAQIKAAISSVPPKVAEVRQALSTATVQLQQLRSDVQAHLSDLRADSPDTLIDTLREIDRSASTFLEAGYQLVQVEMESGMPQRLIVELEKIEDVPHERIHSLATAQPPGSPAHAILAALIKAEALADGVNLANLTYRRLMVVIGPSPAVRLCWEMTSQTLEAAPAPSVPSPSESAPEESPFGSSLFGGSSFFERRVAPSAPAHPAPAPAIAPSMAPAPVEPAAPAAPPQEQSDPLARFKKMPDLSKR